MKDRIRTRVTAALAAMIWFVVMLIFSLGTVYAESEEPLLPVDIQIHFRTTAQEEIVAEGMPAELAASLMVQDLNQGIASVFYSVEADGQGWNYQVRLREPGEHETGQDPASGYDHVDQGSPEDWDILTQDGDRVISMSRIIYIYAREHVTVTLAFTDLLGNLYSYREQFLIEPPEEAAAEDLPGLPEIAESDLYEEGTEDPEALAPEEPAEEDAPEIHSDRSVAEEAVFELQEEETDAYGEEIFPVIFDGEEPGREAAEEILLSDVPSPEASEDEAVDQDHEEAIEEAADQAREEAIEEAADQAQEEAIEEAADQAQEEAIEEASDEAARAVSAEVQEPDAVSDHAADGAAEQEAIYEEQDSIREVETVPDNGQPVADTEEYDETYLAQPAQTAVPAEPEYDLQRPTDSADGVLEPDITEPATASRYTWSSSSSSPQSYYPQTSYSNGYTTTRSGGYSGSYVSASSASGTNTDSDTELSDQSETNADGQSDPKAEQDTAGKTAKEDSDGSTYDLSGIEDIVGKYLKDMDDLVICEINSQRILPESVQVMLSRNGEMMELEKEKDYTFKLVSSANNRKTYKYTIFQDNFAEEGAYRVFLTSEDAAGNQNSNEGKDAPVWFHIDHTEPLILSVDPSEEQEIAGKREVRVKDNAQLSEIEIYLGDQKVEYEEDGEVYRFQVPADVTESDVRVVAKDQAGNTYERTLRGYVQAGKVKVKAGISLVPFGILGAVGAVAAYVIIRRRKRRA